MPTWDYDYRPVRVRSRGKSVPKIAGDVLLTIHGMAFVNPHPAPRRCFPSSAGTALVLHQDLACRDEKNCQYRSRHHASA